MAGPEPLSAASLVTGWTLDPVAAVGSVLAAGAYVGGVRRLARQSRAGQLARQSRAGQLARQSRGWPRGRTAAFTAGMVVIVLATQSGLARYDTVLFSAHVGQHVLLGIVAPLLLALGAPVTLALQAAHRPTQVNLLRVLRSPAARLVGHPLVAWLAFGATLFVLYFSPLYELSLRNDVVHAWVHVHFLVVGSLFAWATIGLDPVPHRLGHGARLLLVLLTVPFHAFLALALMTGTEPLAAAFYAENARTWGPSVLQDQRTGAGIMWLVGDAVSLVVGVILARQWWSAEQRRTRRRDAAEDAATAEPAGPDPPPPPASVASVTHGSIS